MLLILAGCASSGPSRSDLARTGAFTTSMPGGQEVATGGDDPRSTIEGATNGFAWRMLVSDGDEAGVVAWYSTEIESEGWTPTDYGYIGMMDGFATEHAWRHGDLVLGLGFPDRDRLHASYLAGTLYEITVTYQPKHE
jgi:hypothetical protein